MRREVFPGGSYCEAWPDAVFIVLSGNRVVKQSGWINVEPHIETLLYLRGASPSAFVGVNHADHVWEFDGSGWTDHGLACGVNAVIYSPAGDLHINPVGCPYGSQGFRFFEDGRLYTGDETYDGRETLTGSVTGNTKPGLAEWTRHGDVTIGQSYVANDACAILYQGVRRILEPGHCRFIRFNRQGSQCAVAMWKMQENCAVLVWFDVNEIASLPLEQQPVDPPPPPPPPMSTPNKLDVVQDEFAKQPPDASDESRGKFTRRVAWRLNPNGDPAGWGLLTKTPSEGQYQGYAIDAIIYGRTQQVVDICSDPPAPTWQHKPKRDQNHWHAPIQPEEGGDDGDPGDEDPPPPPDVDLQPILDRLAALELIAKAHNAELAALHNFGMALQEDNLELQREIKKLKDQKYKVDIGKAWGHAHPATVIIEPQS